MGDPRTWRCRARWLLPLAAVAALSACSGEQTALDPQGPFAERPDDLFRVVFWIAVGVFVLVQGLIIVAVLKFRDRGDDETLPVQTHGNTKLEILWTVIPALILAGIAVPTVQSIFELSEEPDGAVTIEVFGHRWWWEYQYPEAGVETANEMVIPVGRPVRLVMTAEEADQPDVGVIHSFWVPALAGKQDVIPGRITTLNIQADTEGRYLGQCAEYCGLSHANMRLRVIAVPPDEFDQWLEEQAADAPRPDEGTLEAEGEQLFFGGACVGCHAVRGVEVDGTRATGNVGPDLTHFATREEFAGAIFEVNEDNLAEWLEDPPAMKPMTPDERPSLGMPDLGLKPDEIRALVAYLLSLT
ncbi:MAG: cytochrome c oxidase subunit II [Actinobacteria bacterium]|nr:cytochrome c oxidase subunit II [Actinomycetota bacterium]